MKKTAIITLALAATLAVFSGCGNPGAQYAGLYNGEGTLNVTFNTASGRKTSTIRLDGDLTIFEGASSDLVLKITDNCTVPVNMDGSDSATVVSGSTCTETPPSEMITFTYTIGSIRFDRKTATFTASGNLVDTYDGTSTTGTFTETINVNKVSK